MFKGQPKGLFALALANTGERFGYYTMLAIFLLFIQAKFGYSAAAATQIYSIFLAGVYFMPLIGGILADKIGYGKCVTIGIAVMFTGYLCLSIPTGADIAGKILMFGALALIALGTGLFKGNLQVLVGKSLVEEEATGGGGGGNAQIAGDGVELTGEGHVLHVGLVPPGFSKIQ